MSLEIRRPTEAEYLAGFRVLTTALQVAPVPDADLEKRRASWFLDRALVALDGREVVGNAGSFPFRTLVPGGALVPTAGLTRVGVLPSHRRRGVLTAMMHCHLLDTRERGEPLASLRASEAVIYGRFGYGLAGLATDLRIDHARGRFRSPVHDDGRIRLVDPSELADVLPRAYARSLRRPGQLVRDAWMWERRVLEHTEDEHPPARWVAVHEDRRGRPDGYVEWRTADPPGEDWMDSGGGHRNEVLELVAGSDATEAALWRFVLDIDLVQRSVLRAQPLDTPLRWLLADARALETQSVWDEQWVRLVDVEVALAARTYTGDGAVVIEVTRDPVLPENVGRFAVGGDGAVRVRRRPELRLDVSTLAACYLGGTSFAELAAGGRIEEVRRGAVARADTLFASRPLPWCGTFF
ncbi:MAG TPA: GNAT family N-acetyltransferase [Acidimicrobiales bacterium]|nr:GNAT family N-acetyltransferase [Acidimicrobiales bacterium]